MKLIDVSTKKYPNTFAQVDDEDHEYMAAFRWFVTKPHNAMYAIRKAVVCGKVTSIQMHRQILGCTSDIDHADGNGLNNQRFNLRPCTPAQNQQNRQKGWGSSKLKGVSWCKHLKKWRATIVIDGKQKSLGCFADELEAAKRYDVAALDSFGEFARINGI